MSPSGTAFAAWRFARAIRCCCNRRLASRSGDTFLSWSKHLLNLKPTQFVLDGEIVILRGGHLSFDDLLLRIHPAASRIQKLSHETPATYLLFDLLVDEEGKSFANRP